MEVLVLHHHHQEEASTSSSYTKEGFSIPYFAKEIRDERAIQIHAFTEEKKRVFTLKKIHSIRDRGRSNLLDSLARKLSRFKVRSVVVQDPPNDNH